MNLSRKFIGRSGKNISALRAPLSAVDRADVRVGQPRVTQRESGAGDP